jgi:hypothetical protein
MVPMETTDMKERTFQEWWESFAGQQPWINERNYQECHACLCAGWMFCYDSLFSRFQPILPDNSNRAEMFLAIPGSEEWNHERCKLIVEWMLLSTPISGKPLLPLDAIQAFNSLIAWCSQVIRFLSTERKSHATPEPQTAFPETTSGHTAG